LPQAARTDKGRKCSSQSAATSNRLSTGSGGSSQPRLDTGPSCQVASCHGWLVGCSGVFGAVLYFHPGDADALFRMRLAIQRIPMAHSSWWPRYQRARGAGCARNCPSPAGLS
jgi:hypothetical protein